MMPSASEFREYHERVAARLRLVAEGAQESSLKAGLLRRAARHEQLATSDIRALARANGLDWHAGWVDRQWLREAAD
jgi:hypothetical protein